MRDGSGHVRQATKEIRHESSRVDWDLTSSSLRNDGPFRWSRAARRTPSLCGTAAIRQGKSSRCDFVCYDDITPYWLTNTGASSSRFYWENDDNNFSAAAQKTNQIKVPVAITVFPHEIYRAPESWSRQAYPSLYYFHEVDKGGHFAAWEQPELFSTELRAAFGSLRS